MAEISSVSTGLRGAAMRAACSVFSIAQASGGGILSGIAIAVGTIVDMGIVLTENILRRLHEAAPEESRLEVVQRAATEVGSAVLTAALTTIVSFLPVFTMEAAEGKLFRPLAYTKTFALAASIIIAITIIPAAAHALFSWRIPPRWPRQLFGAAVAAAGAVVAMRWSLPGGAAIGLLGAYWVVEPVLPATVARGLRWAANVAAALAVLVVLSAVWEPLGPERGAARNLVFVGGLVIGLLLFFQLFKWAYPWLLAWALRNKAAALAPPVVMLAAGLTIFSFVTNDIIAPALLGGLVLIVLLIGFTVMQHAFAGGGITHGIVSDVERRALALTGAGDMIWDWDVSADKVFTSPETEQALGLKRGTLEGPAARWLDVLHQLDRDRFRASLDNVIEQRRGRLNQEFRLRAADGHYLWFALKARPVVGSDGEVVRVVGTLVDVTDFKNAEERLLFDAVHDNLTGLPNRELFLDRMEAAFAFARTEQSIRPTVLVIDIDRFKQVNDSVGIAVGDSILLTIARRLARLLKPQDTLARLGGDQFALILLSEKEPARIVAFAETLRRTLRAPIAFNDREIFLTASIEHEWVPALQPRDQFAVAGLRHLLVVGGEELGEVHRADGGARVAARADQRARNHRSPAAAADCIAETTDRAQGADVVRYFLFNVMVAQRFDQNDNPHDQKIGRYIGLNHIPIDL